MEKIGEKNPKEKNDFSEKTPRISEETKTLIIKIFVTIGIIAAFTVGFFFLLRGLGLTDPATFEERVGELGFALVIIFFFLYITQSLFLSFLPGNTTLFISVIAATIFGPNFWYILLIAGVSVIASSIALYFVGRYGGRKLIFWLFGREKVEAKLDWFSTKGATVVPWLFLVPFMTTDLLCLICGAAKMRFLQFLLIVIIFRPVEVAVLIWYRTIFNTWLALDPLDQFYTLNLMIINIFLLVAYHKKIILAFNQTFKMGKRERAIYDEIKEEIIEEIKDEPCVNC